MNTKLLFGFGCLLASTLATSTVNAGPRHGGGNGNHFTSRTARSGGVSRSFVGGGNRVGGWNGQHVTRQRFASGQNWNGQHWNGQHSNGQNWNHQHWSNNWNWHHHHHNNVVFVDFGFPFWGWSYPYYYDYSPYGYYPYGSSYGNYGSGYYGSYNYNYGNGYNSGYGNNYDAKVAELQRRLANAGYYRGEVDGIFGSRTQYALKAYRHDHPSGNDNSQYGNRQYPTLRNQPYSPPPVTTEPTE